MKATTLASLRERYSQFGFHSFAAALKLFVQLFKFLEALKWMEGMQTSSLWVQEKHWFISVIWVWNLISIFFVPFSLFSAYFLSPSLSLPPCLSLSLSHTHTHPSTLQLRNPEPNKLKTSFEPLKITLMLCCWEDTSVRGRLLRGKYIRGLLYQPSKVWRTRRRK